MKLKKNRNKKQIQEKTNGCDQFKQNIRDMSEILESIRDSLNSILFNSVTIKELHKSNFTKTDIIINDTVAKMKDSIRNMEATKITTNKLKKFLARKSPTFSLKLPN